jgi:hypothetical protein
MSAQIAQANVTPAAALPTIEEPPVVDLSSFYRWFDARTQSVPTVEKSRWTPATAMFADYRRWHEQAIGGQPPIDEPVFERELREDSRLSFEMLEVQADFGTEPELKVCLNRALRPAIRAVR